MLALISFQISLNSVFRLSFWFYLCYALYILDIHPCSFLMYEQQCIYNLKTDFKCVLQLKNKTKYIKKHNQCHRESTWPTTRLWTRSAPIAYQTFNRKTMFNDISKAINIRQSSGYNSQLKNSISNLKISPAITLPHEVRIIQKSLRITKSHKSQLICDSMGQPYFVPRFGGRRVSVVNDFLATAKSAPKVMSAIICLKLLNELIHLSDWSE
uniref:Uncharacterized protein n=1 Tax=Glossina palpalis gambiensis TaxID=67801 RepID=A0A1B0BCF6_9MUSC